MSVNRYTVFARRKTLNSEPLYLVRFEAIHRLNLNLKEVLSTNELNLILVASAMDQFPVFLKKQHLWFLHANKTRECSLTWIQINVWASLIPYTLFKLAKFSSTISTYNSQKCSFFEVLLKSNNLWNCFRRSPYKATAIKTGKSYSLIVLARVAHRSTMVGINYWYFENLGRSHHQSRNRNTQRID